MKKSLSIFILTLVSYSGLYANPRQDLQKALARLTSQLGYLQSEFSKGASIEPKPTGNVAHGLPYELVYNIVENIIPKYLSEKPITKTTKLEEKRRILEQQKKTFQAIIRSIAALERTSKEYKEVLNKPFYNTIIIKKLFSLVTPELFNELVKLPKKFIDNPQTISGFINNVLYSLNKLKNLTANDRNPQEIDRAISYVVDNKINEIPTINANFSLDNSKLRDIAVKADSLTGLQYLIERGPSIDNTLLAKAIEADSPNVAKYLLQQGTNVESLTGLFIKAFTKSPRVALSILESPTIDIEDIKENFKSPRVMIIKLSSDNNMQAYEKIFNILLDNGFSPNIKIDLYPHPLTLLNFFTQFSQEKMPLALIQKLLEKGADLDEAFYDGHSWVTPLEYAEAIKNNYQNETVRKEYEKLYNLLKAYKDKSQK